MKKSVVAIAAFFLSCSMGSLVFAGNLKKDDTVYARYALRGKGREVFWHNMSGMQVLVPAGTELKVDAVSPDAMVLVKVDDKKKIKLQADSVQWKKYFVTNKGDLKVNEATDIKEGMAKEEIYAIWGCPSYTAYGVKSYLKSLDDILASDTWYYNVTTGAVGALVKFSNGRVSAVDNYKVAKK